MTEEEKIDLVFAAADEFYDPSDDEPPREYPKNKNICTTCKKWKTSRCEPAPIDDSCRVDNGKPFPDNPTPMNGHDAFMAAIAHNDEIMKSKPVERRNDEPTFFDLEET